MQLFVEMDVISATCFNNCEIRFSKLLSFFLYRYNVDMANQLRIRLGNNI